MSPSQATMIRRISEEEPRGSFADVSVLGLNGLERMRAAVHGLLPAPPIHHLTGLLPTETSLGTSTFSMPASPWWQTPFGGAFPSGVMAWVADAAVGGAIVTALAPGQVVATSDLTLNFLRPVTTASERLIARASLIHAGHSLGLSQATINDAHGRVLGHATTRCFISEFISPPPDPPAELVPYRPPAYDVPDPYLRPAPGEMIPQAVWNEISGLEANRRWVRNELPVGPCVYLFGTELTESDEGRSTITMPMSGWLASPASTVYGGAIAYLADFAMASATFTVVPPGAAFSPLDLKVNFIRPVFPDGRNLVAHATVLHRGRRMAVAGVEIVNADEKRVAVGSSSILLLPDQPWLEAKGIAPEEAAAPEPATE